MIFEGTKNKFFFGLGLTRAGQSMPDILLLPKIASYFDITIDALLGYVPQLSKEQIEKIYVELTHDFAEEEFEVVMQKSKDLVKQYYSCYEFLSRMVCLWLNHYMLPNGTRSAEILEEAASLCEHILNNCKDISLCNDVIMLKASVLLQQKKPLEVIEILESICNPCKLTVQGDGLLINAYLQVENIKKANQYAQMNMFNHLMGLLEDTTQYITIHKDNLALCEEALRRILCVAKAYEIENLNFNVMAVLHYQMAIIYCLHEKKKEAIKQLEEFVNLTNAFLNGEKKHLQSDAYFDTLDRWFEESFLSGNVPRDKKVISDSLLMAFDTPAFALLAEEKEYQKLKNYVEKRG